MDNRIYTITEFTRILKREIEGNPSFQNIWVVGEISNITYHSSGHIYLTLKDENSVLSAVFFKYANKNLTFRLEEGMKVFALGSLNVFEKRGSFQFIVGQIKLEGIGELQKKIEQLKKKLFLEGIFDPRKKKKLPLLPRRIGVVTSPTGAAVRDIIKVSRRRHPDIEIIIAPAIVQGADAPSSIVSGIELLNRPDLNIDIIIAGRGGGSFEDLMAFNEERVVRAFFESRVPIISAVGHQIDHPLSDDAADIAAPTPSAAAEIAVPVKDELFDYINNLRGRAHTALLVYLRELSTRLNTIKNLRSFKNPREILYTKELILDDVEKRIVAGLKELVYERKHRLLSLPSLSLIMKNILMEKSHQFTLLLESLEKLSPLSVLARGYAIVSDFEKRIIKSIDSINAGDYINVHLVDGSLGCTVDKVSGEHYLGKEKS